jgi:hypothetical protein
MPELTQQQLDRQDFVDNTIREMLGTLTGKEEIDWDIELIGNVRDAIAYNLALAKIMDRDNFYPEIDDLVYAQASILENNGGYENLTNVYVTASSKEEARRIAWGLVAIERGAANYRKKGEFFNKQPEFESDGITNTLLHEDVQYISKYELAQNTSALGCSLSADITCVPPIFAMNPSNLIGKSFDNWKSKDDYETVEITGVVKDAGFDSIFQLKITQSDSGDEETVEWCWLDTIGKFYAECEEFWHE